MKRNFFSLTKTEIAQQKRDMRDRIGCLDCGAERFFLSNRCESCRAGYDKSQRAAVNAVGRAIARGELQSAKTQVCFDCGEPGNVWDHRDYTKPLDVQAVCRPCNGRRGPAQWRAEPECDKYRVAA